MNVSIFTDTMADMHWTELEALGGKDIPVLLPMGVIEEHGPHFPLATDIYFSCAVCRMIKAETEKRGGKCLVAPPYYWGINHCTAGFPGSFSLKAETMIAVLLDILGDLHRFGFDRVHCVNFHGDSFHIDTMLKAVKQANERYSMKAKVFLEPYQLEQYGLTGQEDYILIDGADYPAEYFEEDESRRGLFDIHAGAFETASMLYFYPNTGMTDLRLAESLPDNSLTEETIKQWFEGGEQARKVVPNGYAGNPAGYAENPEGIEGYFRIMSEYVAEQIISGK